MRFPKVRWGAWLAVAILGLSAVSVGKALAGADPTIPRAADAQTSKRSLATDDEKLFVPKGSWASGQGVVEPKDRETKVAGAVPGRIARVLVVEGQRVAKGDVLIELDAVVENASIAIAEADVARDEADLSRVAAGERWEDRTAADEEAKAAAARAAQSAGVLERTKRAHAGGAVSGDELDRAEKQASQDSATAAAAEARRRAAFAGSRLEDKSAAQARLAGSRARLKEAQARLEQRIIRAPIDGEVLSVKVRAGEYYQPSSEASVVMGETKSLRVRIDIDERDVTKLRPGARVVARVTANPGHDYAAKVVELGRRMGRKNVRSDDPVERNDAKILEVVAELEESEGLVVGQRVVGFVATE